MWWSFVASAEVKSAIFNWLQRILTSPSPPLQGRALDFLASVSERRMLGASTCDLGR
jgi:hypothetical protein